MWTQILEWSTTAFGITSSWLLGRRNRYGWIVSLVCQVVWLYVASATHQWAFVPSSFVYGVLAIRGWRSWKS